MAKRAQQYYIILLNKMRAQVREISGSEAALWKVAVVCNELEPVYVQHRFASKKYKKVGKEARAKLIKCIQNGWSIINVAKKFNINYSTAKSIAQNHKKKRAEHADFKISSTDECQSHEPTP